MKYFNWTILKQIVQRIFKSKVVLLALGGAVVSIVKTVFEVDINPIMERIVEVVWALYVVYAAANNPTTPEKF